MTVAQCSPRPVTLAEFKAFFTDERVRQLTKSQQRNIDWIDGDTSEEDALEIYTDIFDELPKSKKKPKKEKTAEEIEAEEIANTKAMMDKILDFRNKVKEQVKNADGEVQYITTSALKEKFPRLTDEDAKTIGKAMNTIQKSLATIEINKIINGKKGKASTTDAFRTYKTEKDNKKECAATGDKITVKYGTKKDEPAVEYAVIECDESTQKHGVKLEEGEVCLFNMSNAETKQMKSKPCLRNTPIDKIVGCECAIKYEYGAHIYKPDEDGVYVKVKKDWGCIPCNMKVVDGLKVCARHKKSTKAVEVWTREDLKVADELIISKE